MKQGGGAIGRFNSSNTTTNSASGIWNLNEVHSLKQVSTWPSKDYPPQFEYLMAAGGGGAGYGNNVGGAGGGGLVIGTRPVTKGTPYTITIGAGGVGSGAGVVGNGLPGANSSISGGAVTEIALGGGRSSGENNINGGDGGSGGGSGFNGSSYGTGGSGLQTNTTYGIGYGNPGQSSVAGGRGGGAGGSGAVSPPNGLSSNIALAGNVMYSSGGYSGSGNGSPNTGNGAGTGGTGGSGVVIIRYSNSYPDAFNTTGSPTFTNISGYKIYSFNGTGSITF